MQGIQFGKNRLGIGVAFEQLEQRQVIARYLCQGAPALQGLALAGQRQVGLAVCQAAAHDLG
ncbi:hypothetical protein D3C81_2141000 [compost metagenome]